MRHLIRQSEGSPGLVLPATARIDDSGPTESPSTASRRAFLGRGVAAAAVPAALLAGASSAGAANTNGPFPSYYQNSTKKNFQEIQEDEYAHNLILTGLIQQLGGTARPLASFTGIRNLSTTQFLNLSVTFENTGVHAYLGALPYVQNPAVVMAAAQIALVEAYHSGFLNTLANQPLVPGGIPLAEPFSLNQVLTGIAPFVTNLNDNGAFPPVFGTNPSAANDLAILNFALLLEQLEAEFYFYNVPALFP